MSFSDYQLSQLTADLSRANVKTREQGGRQVHYIEGWHAVAEANRIFGFDAWSRETVELKCVSERERTIGAGKNPGWGVTYIARVRISVDHIVRDGCGSGHGIDRDLGQAHESALKEAETDAMKRALMTFGNPFGLALYDKSQSNVSAEPEERAEPKSKPQTTIVAEPLASKSKDDMIENISGCVTVAELEKYVKSVAAKATFASLPENHRGAVGAAVKARKLKLNP